MSVIRIKKGLSLLNKMLVEDSFRFRLLYGALGRVFAIRHTAILYESHQSKSMTGNPYALFVELVADKRLRSHTHIWILNNPELIDNWKQSNVKLVKRNSIRHVFYLLSSKYLINNNTFVSYVSKRPEQIYLNTWHGTPIKTLGADMAESYGMGCNATRNFMQADYLTLPNKYTVQKILNSYGIASLYSGHVIENGQPRIDLSFQTIPEKEAQKEKIGIPGRKKVILYAPTYRGEATNPDSDDESVKELLERLVKEFGTEYSVIYKGHPVNNIEFDGLSVVNISNHTDTNELLGIVDVLVADYSSISFDFLTLCKPIIYFAFDLEQYKKDRGLYFDLSEMPGEICTSVDSVVKELNIIDEHMPKHLESYRKAQNKYCKYDDGNVSKKIVEAVFFDNLESINTYQTATSEKRKILIYGGGFLNNGVTSSLFALLANIDYALYEVTLISNTEMQSDSRQRLVEGVPNTVNIFYVKDSGLRLFQPLFGLLGLRLLGRWFTREYYALFGNARFDVAIDYSGYGTYWANLIAFSSSDTKCIYLHNDMRKERESRGNLTSYGLLFKLYQDRYDRLITVSESSFRANSEGFSGLTKKLVCVDNPIDEISILTLSKAEDPLWKDKLNTDKINFINIARYSVEKGQDRLLLAFSEIVKTRKDAHLYLVGHGALFDQLNELVFKYGLESYVTLTGNIENPFPLLSDCDCFVLSSHYEGQGLVLLESMVLGIPCISTDIPGPQSVLADRRGLLVDDSVDGLVYGMGMFLKNEVPQKAFNFGEYIGSSMSSFYKAIE